MTAPRVPLKLGGGPPSPRTWPPTERTHSSVLVLLLWRRWRVPWRRRRRDSWESNSCKLFEVSFNSSLLKVLDMRCEASSRSLIEVLSAPRLTRRVSILILIGEVDDGGDEWEEEEEEEEDKSSLRRLCLRSVRGRGVESESELGKVSCKYVTNFLR